VTYVPITWGRTEVPEGLLCLAKLSGLELEELVERWYGYTRTHTGDERITFQELTKAVREDLVAITDNHEVQLSLDLINGPIARIA